MADAHDSDTVIAPGTRIKGEMSVDDSARILGGFEGIITGKGRVQIGDKADCKADFDINVVEIDGQVEGSITARNKVQLNATARVKGDLNTVNLVVAEGASFSGHVTVGPNGKAAPAPQGAKSGSSGEQPKEAAAAGKK